MGDKGTNAKDAINYLFGKIEVSRSINKKHGSKDGSWGAELLPK